MSNQVGIRAFTDPTLDSTVEDYKEDRGIHLLGPYWNDPRKEDYQGDDRSHEEKTMAWQNSIIAALNLLFLLGRHD